MKKAPTPASCYLEPEEVKAIMIQPDRSTIEGQRDHALLSFLYNTGARIQEALDVCPGAIRFDTPACVRLYGKGRKERISPLWPETVSLLRSLLRRQSRREDGTDLRQSVWSSARRFGRPLQTDRVCQSGNEDLAQPRLQDDNSPQLPSWDGGSSCGGGRRHHGDPKLARPRQPGHH
jgi:integrase